METQINNSIHKNEITSYELQIINELEKEYNKIKRELFDEIKEEIFKEYKLLKKKDIINNNKYGCDWY